MALLHAYFIGDAHHQVEIDHRRSRVRRRFCDDEFERALSYR